MDKKLLQLSCLPKLGRMAKSQSNMLTFMMTKPAGGAGEFHDTSGDLSAVPDFDDSAITQMCNLPWHSCQEVLEVLTDKDR